MVTFGTLNEDGTVTGVREIRQSDIAKCRFSIFMPDHYREDGSCRCSDKAHRAMMIADWEYTEADFKGIPLRNG